jgi:hypothetical protein
MLCPKIEKARQAVSGTFRLKSSENYLAGSSDLDPLWLQFLAEAREGFN